MLEPGRPGRDFLCSNGSHSECANSFVRAFLCRDFPNWFQQKLLFGWGPRGEGQGGKNRTRVENINLTQLCNAKKLVNQQGTVVSPPWKNSWCINYLRAFFIRAPHRRLGTKKRTYLSYEGASNQKENRGLIWYYGSRDDLKKRE